MSDRMARVKVRGLACPSNEKADGTVTSPRLFVLRGAEKAGSIGRFPEIQAAQWCFIAVVLRIGRSGVGQVLAGGQAVFERGLVHHGLPVEVERHFFAEQGRVGMSRFIRDNKIAFDRIGRVSYPSGVMFLLSPPSVSAMNPVQDAAPGSWVAGAGVGGFS